MSDAEAKTADPQASEAPKLQTGAGAHEAASFLSDRRKHSRNNVQALRSADPAGGEEQTGETERIAEDAKSQGGESEETLEARQTGEEGVTGEQPGGEETGTDDFPSTLAELAGALEVDVSDLAQGLTVTRRVNGRDEEISIAEAVEGSMRQSDYSRLQNELAQSRQSFEAERESNLERAKQHDEAVQNWLGVVANALQMGPSDSDLVALAQSDPDRYAQVKAHREMLMNAYRQVDGQRQHMIEDARKKSEEASVQNLMAQRDSLTRMSRDKTSGIPDPNDAQKWPVFEGEMRQYLGHAGFTPQDVAAFLSPGNWKAEQVRVIADAMYGRQLRQQGGGVAKKVKHLPKVIKPGTPKDRASSNADKVANARNNLKRQNKGRAGDRNAVALLRANRRAK